MTTLIDVARRAGVSKSTVSNVIRGSVFVGIETRARVEQAIKETGYRPNIIARSLKSQASSTIGVVVPDLRNPFFAGLAVSIEEVANEVDYAVLTANTECLPSAEANAGRALIERRVDGVIVAGVSLGSSLPANLLDHDIPTILVTLGGLDDSRFGVIDHDDESAMEAVVDHLHQLGHRRLAFARLPVPEHAGERRRQGMEAALARRGQVPVSVDDAPTAIVAHNDIQAIATIDRLERGGLDVPGDVSVVGYDDIPLAAHHRIGLTTVRSDAAVLGRHAFELLVNAVREGRHVAHREIQPNPMVIRRTTGSAPP
jgi:LacI family transcriptional regulator, galactose operon repressor